MHSKFKLNCWKKKKKKPCLRRGTGRGPNPMRWWGEMEPEPELLCHNSSVTTPLSPLSVFKSEDTEFDPLAGQGEIPFFCPAESTLVQTCLCLTPQPPTPFVCTARTQICAYVKDPIFICRKRVGFTAGGMENTETVHTGTKKMGTAALWLLTFPGESSCALHWDKKDI